jgi:queuine tRNA-ribosyltransferase
MIDSVPLHVDHRDGAARAGTATLPRGTVTTPCFMPVGTRASVKYLSAADHERLGSQIVLGNTYHLMLRPGADTIAHFGGLNRFNSWSGLSLTDSGGFQVFSLEPKIDDDGVTFRSVYDGSSHRFTPEIAVRTQELIGADVQMVLDVCPPLPSDDSVVRLAMDRTAAWAARARAAHGRDDQALFGIVQGGLNQAWRAESARQIVDIGFSGYAIGGLSVGESRAELVPALAAAIAELPADRPRYLMGVGDPASMVEAVGLGVDLFDCVLQTRLGRHGTILTDAGRVNVKNARFALDDGPLDPTCDCEVCARHSRGYVRHLIAVGEPTGSRLCSIHNIAWTHRLCARMRDAIVAGRYDQFRRDVLAVWG